MAGGHHHGDGHHPPHRQQGEPRTASESDAGPPADPFPLIYSRDPFDERRWHPWESHGPSVYRVGRGAMIFTWIILGGMALVIVLAIVSQTIAASSH